MMRTRMVAVAAAGCLGALAIAGPALASTTPGVNATPFNWTGHSWSSDGCSWSPDRGPNFDFAHACLHHDGCYRNHWADKNTCDAWFYNDMKATCSAMHKRAIFVNLCNGVALTYYKFAQRFGAIT